MKNILILLALTLGLIAAPAIAEIALVNSGSISSAPTTTGPETLTLSGFDASFADYVVVTTMGKVDDSGDLFTSLTYDGSPMTLLASNWMNGTYDIYIRIYGIAVSGGSADIVFSYTDPDGTDDHDSVGLVAAAFSDVDGANPAGAVSDGAFYNTSTKPLVDSITTTNNNSLIVSSFAIANAAVFSDGNSTEITSTADSLNKGGVGLFTLAAATPGAYSPSATWAAGPIRSVTVGVELQEQSAPKATVFMVH